MTTLQDFLEAYLKAEGLYEVIPEHRRRAAFTLPIATIWIVGFWGLTAYFLVAQKGLAGIVAATIGPPTLMLTAILAVSIPFVFRQIRSGKKLSQADTGILGTVILFGLPIVSAVILGAYLGSWLVFVWYIVLYGISVSVLLLLNEQSYRVHLLVELFRSFFGALWQSVTLLVSLIPILLVVVLFSVFTRDLWETLAELSAPQYVTSVLWLAIPAALFVAISVRREASLILGTFPDNATLLTHADATEFIRSKLDRGLISEEEWEKLRQEVIWRAQSKLIDELMPIVQNKVKRWLGLLLGLMAITLAIAFFVYFFVLFTILLSPARIADWTNTPLNTTPISLALFGQTWSFAFPTTLQVTAKVSLLLACFVSIFASISGLSDETIRAIITGWLTNKSASWLAISVLYTCAVSPNYYVWNYIVRNKPSGIANVLIVIRQGLSPKQIKQVCEHMEARLVSYKNFVMVTAFEQNDKRSTYRLDLPDNRWRLLHNKTKNARSFDAVTFEDDEVHYRHFLGRDALLNQTPILDEWFGNTSETANFSRGLWDADLGHEWILHPYVSKHGGTLSIEIHLAKRKAKSQQYREYVREIFRPARQAFSDAVLIMMDLYYRDTTDNLAHVLWNNQLPFVDYKDETMKKTRYERQKDWS